LRPASTAPSSWRPGALDIDPARARDYAIRLGIPAERAYGDWREMLEGENRAPIESRS
jgi:predicted dehydrogenase